MSGPPESPYKSHRKRSIEQFGLNYLTSIGSTVRITGTNKVGSDRLEISVIAIFVPPYRKHRLPLNGALLSAVVGGPPSDHRRPLPGEPLVPQLRRRQADRDHVLGLPGRLVQYEDGDVVVEADPAELRVGPYVRDLEGDRT